MRLHVLAGDASGDPVMLQKAAEQRGEAPWYVIKSSEPGDLAIVFIRHRGLVAIARQTTWPVREDHDGQAKYSAMLGEVEIIDPPIADEDLQEILPEWGWLQSFSRTKTTPPEDVADALVGLIQACHRADEDRDQPDGSSGIESDDYARALETIADQLTPAQRDLLILLAYAPEATLTLPQLAQVVGRKSLYSAYGISSQLSSQLGGALQLAPGEQRLRIHLVATDRRESDGTLALRLYDGLAQAVRRLTWMPSQSWILSPDGLASTPSSWDGRTETRLDAAQIALFRAHLHRRLSRRGWVCAISGEREPQALREVPIKPWQDCQPDETLDPDNYLVLTVALGEAFVLGLWSLTSDGEVMVSPVMTKAERVHLGLDGLASTAALTSKQCRNLMHHRAFVFQTN